MCEGHWLHWLGRDRNRIVPFGELPFSYSSWMSSTKPILLIGTALVMSACQTTTPPTWPAESTHYLYSAGSPTQLQWPQSAQESHPVAAMRDWLFAIGSTYTLGHTYAPRQMALRLGPLSERGRELVGSTQEDDRRLHGVMAWDIDLVSTAYLLPEAAFVEPASPTDYAVAYRDRHGELGWWLWNITAPGSYGPSITGPAEIYTDTRPWIAMMQDGTRAIVVDKKLRVESEWGEPMAVPEAFKDVAVTSVMPMLDATHMVVMVADPRDPRGPRAYVWRPGDSQAFQIDDILGGRVAGERLNLLLSSPNMSYRLSRDGDARPRADKVLSVPSYPRPGSISPDGARMVSSRLDAFGKTCTHAVHAIGDGGTRVLSTDRTQTGLGFHVWLPHGLGAPSRVIVVPPPAESDAGLR